MGYKIFNLITDIEQIGCFRFAFSYFQIEFVKLTVIFINIASILSNFELELDKSKMK